MSPASTHDAIEAAGFHLSRFANCRRPMTTGDLSRTERYGTHGRRMMSIESPIDPATLREE
jgi:hypothetical protein